MLDWFRDHGFDKGVLLRNGVESGRFQPASQPAGEKPFTIGYCGTLSRWIDYELFANLARKNPQWKFVIIGKPWLTEDWRVLEGLPNVSLLGEKQADEVARLIPTFDAALNLYRKHPALDVDSMKLYEYIAAGVPVVSTRYPRLPRPGLRGHPPAGRRTGEHPAPAAGGGKRREPRKDRKGARLPAAVGMEQTCRRFFRRINPDS